MPRDGPTRPEEAATVLTWDTATDRLLALATADLDDGLPPCPTLAAYAGEDGIALVGLRPFGAGELVGPLLELAALLLPLGADRFALALPGRAWSTEDPIPPVLDEVDLRRTVLTLLRIDGHGPGEPRCAGSLYPYGRGADGVARFDEPTDVGWPEGEATGVLRGLLGSGRDRLAAADPSSIVHQFARCLLRGHHVVLAPDVAEHLEWLTVARS